MQSRKHTAWKKNRKFSLRHGGRQRLKLDDNIFKQEHSFLPPEQGEETPIFIVENTSRDFFHPLTVAEIQAVLQQLPEQDVENLTHIWLKNTPFDKAHQTNYIWGSRVELITLYAFPCNLQMRFERKPEQKDIRYHEKYTKDWREDKNGWYLQFTSESIRQFYIEKLLLYSIGQMVNAIWQRYAKNTSRKKVDDFATQYANTNAKISI